MANAPNSAPSEDARKLVLAPTVARDPVLPLPDLLDHAPTARFDGPALKQTLAFAFASGAPANMFDQASRPALLPHSTWDGRRFAKELFLTDFVASCMNVVIEGRLYPLDHVHLVRVLSQPPSHHETVEMRREVLRELATSADARRGLEDIYTRISRLRSALETAPISRRLAAVRRRLEILAAIKGAIDAAAGAFGGATSALARVAAFGAGVRASAAYRNLEELLDYDDRLSELSVRLRLGSDGRIRSFETLAIAENEGNRFYASPLGRLVAKVVFVLRGYRFSEQEVLARVVNGVFDGLEDAVGALMQLMRDMEFYLGALAFADLSERRGVKVCLPELVAPAAHSSAPPEREIRGLFNPLLLAHDVRVVPSDIVTERHDMTVIVTGPNSGGKTRLLQALAFAQLLGQSGMFAPAATARLSRAPGLFLSLIEEAKADHTEGRLGMELIRIRSVFEQLRPGGMVILDELCSGTNPSEGEEIFELVITLLGELSPQAFITTHFLELAARVSRKPPAPRLAFLQVELDRHQYATYRFLPGVAETSLAHRTAARLGVTREELMALIDKSKRTHDS